MNKMISIKRSLQGYEIRTNGINNDILEECVDPVADKEGVDWAIYSVPSGTLQSVFDNVSHLVFTLQYHECLSKISAHDYDKTEYLDVSYPYRSEFFQDAIARDISRDLQADYGYNLRLTGKAAIETEPLLDFSNEYIKFQMRKKLEEVGELKPLTIQRSMAVLTIQKEDSSLFIYDVDGNVIGERAVTEDSDLHGEIIEMLMNCPGITDVQKILCYGFEPSKKLTFNVDLIVGHDHTMIYAGSARNVDESFRGFADFVTNMMRNRIA